MLEFIYVYPYLFGLILSLNLGLGLNLVLVLNLVLGLFLCLSFLQSTFCANLGHKNPSSFVLSNDDIAGKVKNTIK